MRIPVHRLLLGREQLLARLRGLLLPIEGQVVVLHGGGGFGKSTTATKLAHEVSETGTDVWWVSAATEDQLVPGLREIALRAGGSQDEVDAAWDGRASAPDLLWRLLRNAQKPWMLVVDNADDLSHLGTDDARFEHGLGWVRRPETDLGAVLITSRDGNARRWLPDTVMVPVTPMGPIEGASLLRHFAGQDFKDEQSALALSNRLGGMPLVLGNAGAYIAMVSTGRKVRGMARLMSFADYQQLLESRFVEATGYRPAGDRSEDKRAMVDQTFELSLDLLRRQGFPLARPVLRLLSCFALAPVPVDLIDADVLQRSSLFPEITPLGLGEVFNGLENLDLVSGGVDDAGNDLLTLHAVVRDANRSQADLVENQGLYAKVVVELFELYTVELDTDGTDNWPAWAALAPHVSSAVAYAAHVAREGDTTLLANMTAVASRVAWFRDRTGLHKQAAEDLAELHALNAELLGERHEQTLHVQHEWARVLRDGGDWSAAEIKFRELLAIQLEEFGAEDRRTIVTRGRLAGTLRLQSSLAEAERDFRAVLADARRRMGDEDLDTVSIWMSLALCLRDGGRWQEAEQEFRQILEVRTRLLGEDHIDTLMTRNQLAVVLRDLGRLEEALAQFDQVLEARVAKLGPEHRDVMSTRNQRAGTLRRLGQLDEAKREFAEIIEIRRRILGDDHAYTMVVRFHVASLEHDQGNLDEAQRQLVELLAQQRSVLGEDHVQPLGSRAKLAAVRRDLGDIDGAITDLRAVVEGQMRIFRADHPYLLGSRHQLAETLALAGDVDAARREFTEVLALREEVLGVDHPNTAKTRAGLDRLG